MPCAYKTKPLANATLVRFEDGQLWSATAELSFPVSVGSGPDSKEIRFVGTVLVEVEIQAGETTAYFTLTRCELDSRDIDDFEFLCADALRGEIPGFELKTA